MKRRNTEARTAVRAADGTRVIEPGVGNTTIIVSVDPGDARPGLATRLVIQDGQLFLGCPADPLPEGDGWMTSIRPTSFAAAVSWANAMQALSPGRCDIETALLNWAVEKLATVAEGRRV